MLAVCVSGVQTLSLAISTATASDLVIDRSAEVATVSVSVAVESDGSVGEWTVAEFVWGPAAVEAGTGELTGVEIGGAGGRGRGEISGVGASLKKKKEGGSRGW